MAKKAPRSATATVAWLAQAIGQATRSAQFCVAGDLDADPGLVVPGVGACRFPLKRKLEKELIGRCHVAPYGKGTETLVDPRVRNTLELDPGQFQLSDAWNVALAAATRQAAAGLGLPAEQLEARLYKLLVYEKGGFFLPHRDSEKHDRMVASLIVVLPNPFEGGALLVRHAAVQKTWDFPQAASGKAPGYVAFYADCEHEVQRVTRGVRVCLAYNLVLKTAPRAAAKPTAPANPVTQAIRTWIENRSAQPVVFALEHHYTLHGLSLDLLKGADRRLADVVVAAAGQADCLVHLAQVSRHLAQFADDGSLERSYRRHWTPRAIEIGETYEDELTGSEWAALDGTKQPWGAIALEPASIVASVPLDEWTPTREDFEGYTGNAGNTLDRWYHRSALVVWDRMAHFDVIASAGPATSMPLFTALIAKLAKPPVKQRDALRSDAVRFARAIIARWPAHGAGYAYRLRGETMPTDAFPAALRALHDQDTVAQFLSTLAERDQASRISSFVVAACREFGWSAFAPQLRQLLAEPPPPEHWHRRPDIPLRDVEWLSAFCCDQAADPDRIALARELGTLAVERFCAPLVPQPRYRREVSVAEQSLPLLVKALAAGGREEDLARLLDFVQAAPDAFDLDECVVPCLKQVIPWSQKQLGAVPPPLAAWLTAVRRQLKAATARAPAPPADWSRPVAGTCNCHYCTELRTFLAEPATEVVRVRANENDRRHLLHAIQQHQLDVRHVLDRQSRPFTLVLTKTRGSYERAVKRYEADQRLLSDLPVAV